MSRSSLAVHSGTGSIPDRCSSRARAARPLLSGAVLASAAVPFVNHWCMRRAPYTSAGLVAGDEEEMPESDFMKAFKVANFNIVEQPIQGTISFASLQHGVPSDHDESNTA